MLTRWHFYIGLALILMSLWGLFSQSLWWEQYYFAFAWNGWVFFVDALGFGRWGVSLFSRLGQRVLALFILSMPFWALYSWINLHLHLWSLSNFGLSFMNDFFYGVAHSSVIPGLLVTLYFFHPDMRPLAPERSLSLRATLAWCSVGALSLLLALTVKEVFFPLTFCFLALILDPINYHAKRPSLLFALRARRWRSLLLFSLSALVIGLFWESLNGITGGGWSYALPYFHFYEVFAMPALGLLGYIPFAASAFAFVIWFESLLSQGSLLDAGQAMD